MIKKRHITKLCTSNLFWLLLILLTYCCTLLKPKRSAPGNFSALNSRELNAAINSTSDRIFQVKYEPVFEKYFHKHYGGNSKEEKRKSLLGYSMNSLNNTNEFSQNSFNNTSMFNKFWHQVDALISAEGIFPQNEEHINSVIMKLSTAKIVSADVLDIGRYESGTSDKWILMLEGGQKAVLKLMWERIGKPKTDGLCNYGYEMPWAEVLAFHMHRVLGFRNTPYVAGRYVDVAKEIMPVATPRVSRRISRGTSSEVCITGQCPFCTKENRICSKTGVFQASIAYWIPRHLELQTWHPDYMPWATPNKQKWGNIGFNNKSYCNYVKKTIWPYNEKEEYYNDLFDFSLIDTIMYHFDSKHYILTDSSPANGLTIRLDHGRAFCRHDIDDGDIFLAPIFQCCTLRRSSFEMLSKYTSDTALFVKELKALLKVDPLPFRLSNDWYNAFARRLRLIHSLVERCADANGGLNNILV